MANKELLETIRKEIISRIDKRHLSAQAKNELVSLLSFLDTLESEKPMNQDELEKEIEKYFPESAFNTGFNYDDMQDIARHFAKWQKEQDEKRWLEDRDGCFWDGVEEGKKAMKEQMMKEAVEGKVVKKSIIIEGKEYSDWLGLGHSVWDKIVDLNWYDSPYKGKQIRVIIVKEDEK